MGQFNAEYARHAIGSCLRSGESLAAFTEAQDADGGPRTGIWAEAGTTWIGLTSSRIVEVPSANGEVISTAWSKVASFDAKAGMMGSRVSYANTTWPDAPSSYKVDKAFAKAAQAIWNSPKTTVPTETVTAHEALYQRLNEQYWFCDGCGQPCGSPRYSDAPYEECRGCLRSISGIRGLEGER